MTDISILESALLGVVEGLTEFLPVSSTAHLTIAEKAARPADRRQGRHGVHGHHPDGRDRRRARLLREGHRADRLRLGGRVCTAPRSAARSTTGSPGSSSGQRADRCDRLPARDLVSGSLRNLWVVAVALIAWSAVMVLAEARATQAAPEKSPR